MASNSEDSRTVTGLGKEREFLKILILGDNNIGKTDFVETYLREKYSPGETVNFNFKLHLSQMEYEGNTVRIGLYDLYPSSNAPERRKNYPSDTDVVLLCFSTLSYDTLMSISNLWIHEVRAHFVLPIPVLMVGLRTDESIRRDSNGQPENKRKVDKPKAEIFHKYYRFHGDYIECSPYNETDVKYVVDKAIRAALEE